MNVLSLYPPSPPPPPPRPGLPHETDLGKRITKGAIVCVCVCVLYASDDIEATVYSRAV